MSFTLQKIIMSITSVFDCLGVCVCCVSLVVEVWGGGGGGVEDGLREKRGIGLKGSEKLVRE